MQHHTSTFTTTDGKSLFRQDWLPEKDPVAVVLYVHGLGSHSSRLAHWAERFVNEGVAFIGYDQRGHGNTEGKRGQVRNIGILSDDLAGCIKKVRGEFPGKLLLLYGHSMGGAVTIHFLLNHDVEADGFIISSPWISLVKPPGKALLSIAGMLNQLSPGARLPNGLNADDVIDDPFEVKKYKDDPLVHDRIAVGLFYSLTSSMAEAASKAGKIRIPCLAMHGAGEKITDPSATKAFAEATGGTTTLKLWELKSHELHNDPKKDEVFKYVSSWVLEQVGKNQK